MALSSVSPGSDWEPGFECERKTSDCLLKRSGESKIDIRVQNEDQCFLLASSTVELHLGQISLENYIGNVPVCKELNRAGVHS